MNSPNSTMADGCKADVQVTFCFRKITNKTRPKMNKTELESISMGFANSPFRTNRVLRMMYNKGVKGYPGTLKPSELPDFLNLKMYTEAAAMMRKTASE